MGVRFECPNGHKLHVKADLTGRRGVCPECGARFIVPSFSGGVATDAAVATDPGNASATGASALSGIGTPSPSRVAASPSYSSPSIVIATTSAKAAAAPSASHAGAVQASPPPILVDDAQWYVRPPSGEQFGPAPTAVFRQWVAEGRVGADCWVWRTGWTDWKAGAEVLAAVANATAAPRPPAATGPAAGAPRAASVRPEPVLAMPAGESAAIDELPADDLFSSAGMTQQEVSTADARRAELRRRRRRTQLLSMALGALALVVLIVLLVVLTR